MVENKDAKWCIITIFKTIWEQLFLCFTIDHCSISSEIYHAYVV